MVMIPSSHHHSNICKMLKDLSYMFVYTYSSVYLHTIGDEIKPIAILKVEILPFLLPFLFLVLLLSWFVAISVLGIRRNFMDFIKFLNCDFSIDCWALITPGSYGYNGIHWLVTTNQLILPFEFWHLRRPILEGIHGIRHI